MPPPGTDFDQLASEAESFGDIVDIGVPNSPGPPPSIHPGTRQGPEDDGGPPGEDEPPAHAREPRRRARRDDRGAGPRKIPRVTAATRTDIEAKISFAAEIPGRLWQARDPVCGTAFIEQRPEIAAALTEIVCQSSDLVAWFTGTGGQFMLWLNLAAACWPVATVIMAHHVYHTIEAGEAAGGYGPAPDLSRYAA